LLVLSRIKQLGGGEFEVLIDNEVSRENVTRAAQSQGWEVREGDREGDDYRLVLNR